MFKLTRNLKIFAAITVLMALAFHWTLSWLLSAGHYIWIFPLALGFFFAMFFNGMVNGRHEDAFHSRVDLSFAYHLTTFLLVVPIWIPFLLTRPEIEFSGKLGEAIGILSWGLGLLIHYFASRRSIKGYSREEVFD